MARDFYQELGVPRTATAEEIRSAYRKLAAKFHPDRNPGNTGAETRFKAVNRAHQAIGDPAKRALYDEFGEEGLREGFNADAQRAYRRGPSGGSRAGRGNVEDMFGGGAAGIGDLFGDLFGARSRQRATRKGADVQGEVTVDFTAAIRGAELKLQLQEGGEEVTVRVPKGAGDGDKVRVPERGGPGSGGAPPGDLLLTIRVRPHPFFERDGLDLSLDLPITVGEAYKGAKVRVPTPDGMVTMTVPKHAQSGQHVRLKRRGVERKDEKGDLYVRFLIRLPDADTTAVQRAIDVLQKASDEDVRKDISFDVDA